MIRALCLLTLLGLDPGFVLGDVNCPSECPGPDRVQICHWSGGNQWDPMCVDALLWEGAGLWEGEQVNDVGRRVLHFEPARPNHRGDNGPSRGGDPIDGDLIDVDGHWTTSSDDTGDCLADGKACQWGKECCGQCDWSWKAWKWLCKSGEADSDDPEGAHWDHPMDFRAGLDNHLCSCECDGCHRSSDGGFTCDVFDCDDGDACTVNSCDPNTVECQFVTLDCDDGNACTVDSCDSNVGCQHVPVDCDDGDACTVNSCSTSGTCVSTTLDCGSDDPADCITRGCDAVTGCFEMQNLGACDRWGWWDTTAITTNPERTTMEGNSNACDATIEDPDCWHSAYGQTSYNSGIVMWTVKLDKLNTKAKNIYDNVVGVSDCPVHVDTYLWSNSPCSSSGCKCNGFGYIQENGNLQASGGPFNVTYGKAWKEGDEVTVIFDIDNRILSFELNGVSQGVAFDSRTIPVNTNLGWNLGFSLLGQSKVSIVV